MANRSWPIALGLLALPMVHATAADLAILVDPKDKIRIVQLDLSEVRPGPNKVKLPAPIADSYKLQIVNRIPTSSYEVSFTGAEAPLLIQPADLSSISIPSAELDSLNCATLKRYPLGRLCKLDASGKPNCVDSEGRIASETEKILKIVEQCSGLENVLEALRSATTATLPPQGVADRNSDWEREVKVSRKEPPLALPWLATISTCAPESQLEAYLRHNYPAEELMVLAFDHREQTWTGRRWDLEKLAPIDKLDFENSFTNKPQLRLQKDEQLVVFATNTNPLLFSTTITKATEANIPDLQALQQFTGFLGTFLTATIKSLPEIAVFRPSPPPSTEHSELDSVNLFTTPPMVPRGPEQSDPYPLLRAAARTIRESLKGPVEHLQKRSQDLAKRSGDLKATLRKINEENAEIKNYLQLVELASDDGIEPRNHAELGKLLSDADHSFEQLQQERNSQESQEDKDKSLVCPAALVELQEAVRLARHPLPDKAIEQKLARDRFLHLIESLNAPTVQDCKLASDISVVVLHLEKFQIAGVSSGSDADNILRPLQQGLEIYTGLLTQRSTMLEAAGEALAKRGDIAKGVGGIHVVLDRQRDHLRGRATCGLRAGVLQIARVEGKDAKLRWSKIRTEEFKLAVDSGYKDSLTLTHPAEATANYELTRKRKWDVDVDMAVIYTEIVDPVFTAFDPDNKADTLNSFIARTDEKSRAGDLAMFVGLLRSNRMVEWATVGPQLGLGLDPDHPSLFVGGAVGLGPYVKLGLGWSWQQVKELRSGQIEGVTLVPNNDAVRTRNTFDDGFYASLSITVDELPFFKPKDSQ